MTAYAKVFGGDDDIKKDNEINEKKNYADRMHLALHRRWCRAVLGKQWQKIVSFCDTQFIDCLKHN